MDIFTIIIILLFFIGVFIAYKVGHKAGCFSRDRSWERELPNHRKDAIMKSRAVIGGNFTENLAPYLPDFPYLPTECRFVGKPTDFIVFKGMDEKDIREVVFVEVKSGKARLSNQEKKLKEAINKKRVRFEEYRIPGELTEKGDIDNKVKDIVERDDY